MAIMTVYHGDILQLKVQKSESEETQRTLVMDFIAPS